ncbi:MAG: sensor histidine kinase [Deltaproteobacteria bacterium]|jgi:sensor histidine kinase regulating citrate/malate metabolism|nr:sensor histidine kinase [Deltaproteobacteria bacterium]
MSKMLILDISVATAVLLLSVGLAARYSVDALENRLIDNLFNIAQLLATNDDVKTDLAAGQLSSKLENYLDAALANLRDVDVISIADMKSKRLYHPDKAMIGQQFVGGDEGPALLGQNYHSEAVGTLGFQSRYFYPVYDDQGAQIGFVHVSMLMDNLSALRSNVFGVHLKTLALVFLVSTILLVFLSISIKRSLLGYEPAQISKIFLQRQEVIDSLEEGLLAIDDKGAIILVNAAAEKILDLPTKPFMGEDVDAILPCLRLKESLGGTKAYNINLVLDQINVIYNKLPINSRGRLVGALAIIRDRSELTRMAEQLTGFNHLLDALRANTHEFKNQLHVILGLLRSGAYEEVEKYISQNDQYEGETLTTIAKNIENRALGALVLGKINQCHEMGVRMNLLAESKIPRHSRFLSTKNLITIVGNLVENALEAIVEADRQETLATAPMAAREISLLIHEDGQGLIITVDDTGVGCSPEEIAQMIVPGYTTKGPGHGQGLGLIRAVVDASKGQMTIDSEKGVGTSMELSFREPRNRRGDIPQGDGQ